MEGTYKWLEKLLDDRYSTVLEVRDKVKEVLDNKFLSHYTDHSISHTDRLIQKAQLLIENNLKNPKNRLTNDELTCLILSFILHDISMEIPKAHGIDDPIEKLSPEKLEKLIRDKHGEVSAKILRETLRKQKDTYKLGILNENILHLLDDVAQLCECHQSNVPFNHEAFGYIGSDYDKSDKLRTGLLTVLLHVIDQLDCDYRRVHMNKLEEFEISMESQIHWFMCHYINSVSIEKGIIQFHAKFPPNTPSIAINYLCSKLIIKLHQEIDPYHTFLWQNDIHIKIIDEIDIKTDFSHTKKPLSYEVLKYISKQKEIEEAKKYAKAGSKEEIDTSDEFIDWMTYWGMKGDPFTDMTLSLSCEEFINTKNFIKIRAETKSLIQGKIGELKMVIGERGLGKTTIFNALKESFDKDYQVEIVDVGTKVGSKELNNLAEFQSFLFNEIFSAITDRKDIDPIDAIKQERKKIICIDGLDRLPQSQDEIIQDFFKNGQYNLSEIKRNHILLISCSDRWEEFFSQKEWSYLTPKNQWRLKKFSTKETRKMLDKRLAHSGLEITDIFDESCIPILRAAGEEGNPRKILEHVGAVCRLGAQKGIKKIDTSFIKQHYHDDFEKKLKKLLFELSNTNETFKKGSTLICIYYADLERRNLDVSEGWEYLIQILNGDGDQSMIAHQYLTSIKHIASFNFAYKKYQPFHQIETFFKLLKRNGYSPRDFLSYYSANPYPPENDDEAFILKIRSALLQSEDIEYFNKAIIKYDEAINKEVTPWKIITTSWEALENIILAILIKKDNFKPNIYELKKEEAFYYDSRAIKRHKQGAGKIMANNGLFLFNAFKDYISGKKWINSYQEMKWILDKRNNIIRGKSDYLANYGTDQAELCKGNIRFAFKELYEYYYQ